MDIKAAQITGSINLPRVRVIWRDGRLLAFDAKGKVFDISSNKPKRRPFRLRQWSTMTDQGEIQIKEKCWTCGGWYKIARVPVEELR